MGQRAGGEGWRVGLQDQMDDIRSHVRIIITIPSYRILVIKQASEYKTLEIASSNQ